jgi:aspartyl-tRNA(Asn)/glutamyl-tRNA(Gln) amidotransferase subunit A
MNYPTLAAVQQAILDGKHTCLDLVNHHLKLIEQHDDLNIFLETFYGEARQRATVVDQKLQRGTAGKLAGMVIAIKDNICYKGHTVSASSKILEHFVSLFSSTAVDRLLEEDAIIIGRTNCDEFAMGSSNENSAFGPVKNPLDTGRVAGGSSGGSAAAVAANLCQVALGSDTGGSIRQPASFTGTIGLKPTYGRVSRHGLIAYASSFDVIGPFSKSIEDAALVMEVISGGDDFDGTATQREVPPYSQLLNKNPIKRIGYIKETVEGDGVDPEVSDQFQQQLAALQDLGYEVKPLSFPYLDVLVPIYYLITTAEASSNLARYDGIHAGYRSENAHDLESTYKLSRSEGFGTEVKRRIMLGTFVLSSGYYDAYFSKAQKARRFVRDTTLRYFNDVDVILSPTSPHTAFKIGLEYKDPTVLYLEDIFTVQANIAGLPAISLPLMQHSNGLPLGLQVMGNSFSEVELLAFAKTLMNQ